MRRIGRFFAAVLCCMLLTTTVFAETTATRVDSMISVGTDGNCQVVLTVNIKLETAASGLTFPLPTNAKNVTVSGVSVRTTKSDGVLLADLSSLDGLIGEYTMVLSYSLTGAVAPDEEGVLTLTVPLLSGFAYPVDSLSFSITLPGDAVYEPTFYSGYLQQSVESSLKTVNTGKTISGYSTRQLNDHETLYMAMEVTKDMFPGFTYFRREGNPETIFMAGCGILALLYWLLALRTGPILRRHQVTPLEGVTAGELGCRLTMTGGDLTMMVFSWAAMGYLQISVDKRGKVLLHKRMEMGNERGPYENRCFQALFGRRRVVDATGEQYAKLCQKAAKTVPGIQEMYRKGAGNVKVFRGLCAGISLFCGVCLAMNMASNAVAQALLAVVLAALGAITAWNIQAGIYRIHLRGKLPLLIGGICGAVWIVLGAIAGQTSLALLSVLAQMCGGFLAAYGGRRSELGRYSASQVLGLRHYLANIAKPELQRLTQQNPEYFFEMLPYAMALGVDGAFAKQFGRGLLPECPYLTVPGRARRSATGWAELLRRSADDMDKRRKRMQLEKWIPFTLRK